jgi:DNA mismatch endonuclease (patch repair protein)
MKRVRRERTLDENLVFEALEEIGVQTVRNDKLLPGTPDLTVPASRLAIFVDGDLWHGRAWFDRGAAPNANREFWIERFESNRRRDRRVDRKLRQLGWRVTRVWGADVRRVALRAARRLARRVERLHSEPCLTD